jgi:hypothetical protein
MAREDEYQDAEQARRGTDRLGAPGGGDTSNPNWRQRSTRPTGRNPRATSAIPTSSQDFVVWLQYGGWRFVLAAVIIVAFVAAAIILTSPQESAGTTPELPIVRPTSSIPLQTPLPTVTIGPAVPTPQTAGAAPTGATFRVQGTGAEGLFLRPQPNREGSPITTLPEGSEVTVIGEDSSQTDGVWKNVKDAQGNQGWAFGQFLKAVGP